MEHAADLLLGAEDIKKADQGMTLIYTGDTGMIEECNCLIFTIGTNRDDKFVKEDYYGVCGNLIYVNGIVNDTWKQLETE